MDNTEDHALKFLESLRLGNIAYEPDGNVPPDFLVGGEIAVEVRRLNQHYFSGDNADGLENTSRRLFDFLDKLCAESGPPKDRSYFLRWTFRRPLSLNNTLKRSVRDYLENIDVDSIIEEESVSFENSPLSLSIRPASKPLMTKFRAGGFCDFDAGGWVGAEYKKNIEHVCKEKFKKIQPYRKNYERWWLVLPDFFWSTIDPEDYDAVPTDLCERFQFERIVVVSISDATIYHDVGNAGIDSDKLPQNYGQRI